MDPIIASQALRLIASNIEASDSPSISDVISDLNTILGHVESDGSRTAGEHIAGPSDWLDSMSKKMDSVPKFMKGLKRKLVNTKGAKKILDRMDRRANLIKWIKVVTKKVRNGEDLYDIVSDDDYLKVFEEAAKFMTGGSELLNMLSEDDADVGSIITELDEWWVDNDDEDEEESDRDIILNALSELSSESEEKILNDRKRLLRQNSRQEDGKKIKVPDSKRKAPKKKPRDEEEPEEEPEEEEPAKKPAKKKPIEKKKKKPSDDE